jgi:hypothetical protein
VLLRVASRRATDAELGDLMEEYVGAGRSVSWFVRQAFSIARLEPQVALTPSIRMPVALAISKNRLVGARTRSVPQPGDAATAE